MTDFKFEQQGKVTALIISGALTIECAGEFRAALAESIEKTSHLILDMDNVTDMDLSCLQLLCSAHRTFVDAHKSIELKSATALIKQSANDAGFHRDSGCGQETEQTCFWKRRPCHI